MASSTVERKRFGGTNVRGGPPQPHLRTDRWWLMPLVYIVVLGGFVVYSSYAILIGKNFMLTDGGRHIVSPFYSPCTANICGDEKAPLLGAAFGEVFWLSRIFWMMFPLMFRGTCYYYRKAYYRSFFFSPAACAVAEPRGKYSGERRFPLVLQNIHRFVWFITCLYILMLAYDAVRAYDFNGGFGMSLATVVLTVNLVLLSLYQFSCHSCRHVVGGQINHFSKHPVRYAMWKFISKLNARHGMFAWISLVFVGLCDAYVRMVSAGWFHDPRFF